SIFGSSAVSDKFRQFFLHTFLRLVRKLFSSVKISKVRGKIFTIVVTRVDSALNDNVPALQAGWDK
ncbi:hypothetical protein LIT13_14070, partial [Flavobacterium psychrophilum]|uniref:hypothetical protein n=1 Tax=Flavobacterium psychrophilum TaxID=96345 RepID=UPI001D074FAE